MPAKQQATETGIDWKQIARTALISREIDNKEEQELVPGSEVRYQFSAKGHELGQILLGAHLKHQRDCVSGYYRSRPLMLSLGLSPEDAIAASMAKSGGYSNGRDVGVVCNRLATSNGPTILPAAGDVGSQYTPAIGWAQGIMYHQEVLEQQEYERAVAVALGGDGSVATNGFWSAITIATTRHLPILFYIEDNNYGLSVPSEFQTPGGNIAKNLYSYKNLRIFDGDGTDPKEAEELLSEGVEYVRERHGPVLVHLEMPRLCGHSSMDNQAYKTQEKLKAECENDPLKKLKTYCVPGEISQTEWEDMEKEVQEEIATATDAARRRAEPDPEKGRINMVEAIRRTLETELEANPRLMVFGEDVGVKGGVHAATKGLQQRFGNQRVFDTSLSEEGIIGRAVGLAYAGLMPVAEIQFRKYADSATTQLKNCGTIR